KTPAGPIDFVTMELLVGQTLSDRLHAGKLAEGEALIIARQICSGLAEAHRHHIIHGDLKTANVILTTGPDGGLRAVITDFGLARAVGEDGSPGGTPGYMAPEVCAGRATTVGSDIYALGVILHELASGLRPDQHAAMMATTVTMREDHTVESPTERKRRLFSPRTPKPLHSRWDPVLKRCLQVDPAHRYRSVDEIAKVLGPSLLRRRLSVAAAGVALTALAVVVTYQHSV